MSRLLPRLQFRWGIASFLIIGMVLVIALLMASTTILDIRRTRAIFREGLEQRAHLLAETLNDVLADPLYFAEVDDLGDIAKVISSEPEVKFVRVFGADGRLLVDTEQQGRYPIAPVDATFPLTAIRDRKSVLRLSGDTLEIATPIEAGQVGLGGVQLGFSTDSVDAEIRAITTERIQQFLVLIFAGTGVSYLMAQHLVRPLRRLVGATQRVAAGEFEFSAWSQRSDEIGELTHAFTHMTRRLQAYRTDVEKRTGELEAANERPRLEIAGRKRAQEALTLQTQELAQAEDATRKMETRYRDLYEEAPNAYFLVGFNGLIRAANKRSAELFGHPLDELIGLPVFDLYADTPAGKEKVRRHVFPRFRAGVEILGEELEIRRPDGSQGWISLSMRPIKDAAGQVVASRSIAVDVTTRKQVEEALAVQTRELARSNAELEQFAYIASHDLQEPLRMVSSYTQLLARRYRGQLDSDADDFIAFPVDGAERMQTLIRDLLAYSRAGSRGSTPAPTSLDEVFDNAVANLRAAIEESDAEVTRGPLPTLSVDASRLTQLVQNLIGNALKFRREVEPRVHVVAEVSEEVTTFSVSDNGIGIEAEYLERIFGMFQRLHTRSEYSGTGIGLAICRRIVEQHQGRIWVESEPGVGTTFYFTVPKDRS